MWTQPSQSVLLQLLIQANAFNLLCLLVPTLAAPIMSLQTQSNGTTAQVLTKRHRIVARRSDFVDKLVMPIDLSILRSIPDLPVDDILPENPVVFAVDLSALHGRTAKHDPDPRTRHRGDVVRNDIVLIPDLTLPARIKNDYTQPHRLSARLASFGNDRIPVFDHLHSSYRQGHSPKDALWDFMEYQMDEDNNLFPGKSEDDYPDDYGSEEDDTYWYNQGRHEDEYEGSDNKIKSPLGQFRDKKNVFVSESWRPGGHTQIRPESQGSSRIQVGGVKTKGSRTPFTKDISGQTSIFGLSSWRPGGKRLDAII